MLSTYLITSLILLLAAAVSYVFYSRDKSERKFRQQETALEKQQKAILDLEEKLGIAESQIKLKESKLLGLTTRMESDIAELLQFKEMISDSELFHFELDQEGRFSFANNAMLAKLGYSLEELQKTGFQQFIPPGKEAHWKSHYGRVLKTQKASSYHEWEIINRFDEPLRLGIQTSIRYGKEGTFLRATGSARCISNPNEAGNEAARNDLHFERCLQSNLIPCLLFQSDENTSVAGSSRLVWANRASLQFMNLQWFEVENLPLEKLSSSLTQAIEQKRANMGASSLWKSQSDPAKLFQVCVSEAEPMIMVQLFDVSEEEQVRLAIRKERDFYLQALDHSGLGIQIVSAHERILYLNPAIEPNENLRQWMVGKTEEEIMKSSGKELNLSLRRKSMIHEAQYFKEKRSYLEYIPHNDGEVKTVLRQIFPFPESESDRMELILASLDLSDVYTRFRSMMESMDLLRFRFRVSYYKQGKGISFPSLEDLADPGSQTQEVIVSDFDRFNGFGQHRFRLYPVILPAIGHSLQPSDKPLGNLLLTHRFSGDDNNVVHLPVVFLRETLRETSLIRPKESFQVLLELQPEAAHSPVLQMTISPVSLQKWTAKERKTLQPLIDLWNEERLSVRVTDTTLQFGIPFPFSNQADLDVLERQRFVLQDKNLIVGPLGSPKVDGISNSLRNFGAGVMLVQSGAEIGKWISSNDIHLIVWLGSPETVSQEFDFRVLSRMNLKVLLFDLQKATHSVKPNVPDHLIVCRPIPRTSGELVEQVWLHAGVGLLPANGHERPEHMELNFDKLLEITEGDKDFMGTLFNSYLGSLAECKTEYERHIRNEDPDGLKFLLHKIRATIKTFDIRILEQILSETILKTEQHEIRTEAEKTTHIKLVHRIINQVKANLRAFAKSQDIHIESS